MSELSYGKIPELERRLAAASNTEQQPTKLLRNKVTEEEVAEFMDLIRWFTGRYPTAKERFAYVKRKYAEWTRNPPARIEHAAHPGNASDETRAAPGPRR